jgi:N-acetylglucosamine kinase-like BadF-type ATPase
VNTIHLLTIDGGGTHCRAALCDVNGHILAYSKGGPCNYQNIGIEKTIKIVSDVLKNLFQNLQQPIAVKIAVVGMAGLDSNKDFTIISQIVNKAFSKSSIQVEQLYLNNDGVTTLFGVLGDSPGILAISGTGSIICGKGKGEKSVRVGGWGHRIGDEGSGFAIGNMALKYVFQSLDKGETNTPIGNEIFVELELHSIEDLYSWIYSEAYSIEKVASLSPCIFRLAHEEDQAAKSILLQAGKDLANACLIAIQRLNLNLNEHFTLIVAGSVLQKDVTVLDSFVKSLTLKYSHFNVRTIEHEPIYYYILYGLNRFNIDTSNVKEILELDIKKWESKSSI